MTTRRDFIMLGGFLSLLGFQFWRSPKAMWQLIAPQALAQSYGGPSEYRDTYLTVTTAGNRSSTEVLLATQWQAGGDVPLKITAEPGLHDHGVIIPGNQIAALTSGQTIRFQSELVQGHRHQVSVSMGNVVPNGNVIPNGPKTNPPDQNPIAGGNNSTPPTETPSKTSDEAFAVILGEGNEPYLYLESQVQLDQNSVFYCQGGEGNCSRLTWTQMVLEPAIPGRMIYRSKYPLKLTAQEVIHISAYDLAGQRREFHGRVSPIGNGLYLSNK